MYMYEICSTVDEVPTISVVQAHSDRDCSTWYANKGGHPCGRADVDQGEGDAERADEGGEECSALYPRGDCRVEGAAVSRRQMPTGEQNKVARYKGNKIIPHTFSNNVTVVTMHSHNVYIWSD